MKRLLAFVASTFLLLAAPAFAANCSGYPYLLQNGQPANANQVMANFNSILGCGNTNLAKAGANDDITSLSHLTTPLSQGQGGTGSTTGISSADVTNALGFTPANKSGDTFTGTVAFTDSNYQIYVSSSTAFVVFNAVAPSYFAFNRNTSKLSYVVNGVTIFSVDDAGNAVFAGNVTANGTP